MHSSTSFFFYGLFILLSGILSFHLSGYESKARTSLIMGVGIGSLFMLLSMFSRPSPLPPSSSSSHPPSSSSSTLSVVGLLLMVAIATIFSWRASKLVGVVEKAYLLNMFVVMIVGTIVGIMLVAWDVTSRETGGGKGMKAK